MRFTSAIYSAVMVLMASQAMGAAVEAPANEARAAEIATDPCMPLSLCVYYHVPAFRPLTRHSPTVHACNCPNNCSYNVGHSCRYRAGPSDISSVVKGSTWLSISNIPLPTFLSHARPSTNRRNSLPERKWPVDV